MFCSISGQTPEDPVVSTKSGHLYEKRLIEKHLREEGTDPVTKEALSVDELLSLKANPAVKPRPPTATSVPGLLSLFHNEWDALMLEQHSLREQLNSVRQELSQSLYQHDAACRVIARLIQERDTARAELATAQKAAPVAAVNNGKRALEAEDESAAKKAKGGITPEILGVMTGLSKDLSKGRKKRKPAAELATAEEIAEYTQVLSQPLHKTTSQGITCCDLHPTDANIMVTGGMDHDVVVFDKGAGKITSKMTGHSKKITAVNFVPKTPEVVVSSSADKTTRVWKGDGTCAAVLSEHSKDVTSLSVHPTSKYFVTASLDSSWCFYDLESAQCCQQVKHSKVESGYTAATFHPDGLILGTATQDNLIRIWDMKSQDIVWVNPAEDGHASPVTGMSFSENGYHLATCAADGIRLWDLRKPKCFKTFNPYAQGTATNCVKFDYSGMYLGVGGGDVKIYGVKSGDVKVIKEFQDVPKAVTALSFGTNAKMVAVASKDRNLRLYSTA
mmetsp:Transcript_9892/g.11421  ORF Transcript_9892/g.11421 Transcript_9892/m.11421 type:complete len:503 (-) Transcript_9892:1036-2544(-)|eukprot:CAMPEP_0197860422 /NCGR_PEP_ID=MMETSP1438-20131217/35771_1 /TAXON_ID=1461541 /ORGANISM="Pterosperma sp., Strain CCMP1384" /LENGTH=502 /DNA_ID=CAMNT_0043477273 /DNA_START=144 /DNA_END=1652 /DNA_ORIENTATION=-